MVTPPGSPTPDELSEIRAELTKQALQLDFAQQYQKVSDELKVLKADIDHKWAILRLVATISSVAVTVAGIILSLVGLHTLKDAKKILDEKIDRNIQETADFYGDVIAGSALFARGRYDDAIAKLLKCFNNGHTYDPSVLVPLLASMNIINDWDHAKSVMQKLQSDPAKFDQINDAQVLAIMGAIEIQSGMARYGFSSESDANEEMRKGQKLLEQAYYMAGSSQNDLRQHILTNQWLYHIAKREFDSARQNIASLESLPSNIQVYSWEDISKWRCMVSLAERDRSDTIQQAKQQWIGLSGRYYK